ncbi:MAG: putative Ig domain-containing protein, partial [Rhizobiales bacterium]|nr:putative Ig domain-containing protein [Hyphomicrobiales bacterium]
MDNSLASGSPTRLAQASGATPKIIKKITRPTSGEAVVIDVARGDILDLSAIADQRIVMVRAGDRLIILFDDKQSVVLKGFYTDDGQPLGELTFLLGPGQEFNNAQLAQLFPVSTDTSVLPASGPASAAGNSSSARNVTDPVFSSSTGANARNGLGLLENENNEAENPQSFNSSNSEPDNQKPIVVNPIGNTSTLEDALFSFGVASAFSDPNFGDVLRYSLGPGAPAWLSINELTGILSGIPQNADVGTTQIVIIATDSGGLTTSTTFSLTVINTNDPVSITAATNPAAIPEIAGDSSAQDIAAVTGTITVSDQDLGDTLTL